MLISLVYNVTTCRFQHTHCEIGTQWAYTFSLHQASMELSSSYPCRIWSHLFEVLVHQHYIRSPRLHFVRSSNGIASIWYIRLASQKFRHGFGWEDTLCATEYGCLGEKVSCEYFGIWACWKIEVWTKLVSGAKRSSTSLDGVEDFYQSTYAFSFTSLRSTQ